MIAPFSTVTRSWPTRSFSVMLQGGAKLKAAACLTCRFEGGRPLLDFIRLVGFVELVDKIEYHCRGQAPFSAVINGPDGIRFWELIYECLNKWVWQFAGLGLTWLNCVDERQNWGLVQFADPRYQRAFFVGARFYSSGNV